MGYADLGYTPCIGTIGWTDGSYGDSTEGSISYPCGARHETTEYQLPYRYQVLKERAAVQPCCQWVPTGSAEDLDPTVPTDSIDQTDPNIYSFSVYDASRVDITLPEGDLDNRVVGGWEHEEEPSFIMMPGPLTTYPINDIPTRCKKEGAEDYRNGADGFPPCNGAKTSCPFYSGLLTKYLEDEHLAPGSTVKGQIVQELRALSQDWISFIDPEETWNSVYEFPYIWGRGTEEEDYPIYTSGEDGMLYTVLTQISWDIEVGDATLTRVNSADDSTEVDSSDTMSPPKFPTIVRNLRTGNLPPIRITCPPLVGREANTTFIHEGFEKTSDRFYIAGIANALSNVYVINLTLVTELDSIEDMDDASITSAVLSLLQQDFTEGIGLEGFHKTTSNEYSFFQIAGGIKLEHNTTNKICAMVYGSGQWLKKIFNIDYRYYHCDIIQDNTKSMIPHPSTDTLVMRLANLTQDLESPMTFSIADISSNKLEISSVYNFHILDRSLSRSVNEFHPDRPPDHRFWRINTETLNLTGYNDSAGNDIGAGNLSWTRLDNCYRYLVVLDPTILSKAIPAGLDRSWEPINITFEGAEMKVSELGRSFGGDTLPINYIIVEPKTEGELPRSPSNDGVLSMEIEVYTANSFSDGEDDYHALCDRGFKDIKAYSAGGQPIITYSDNERISKSPHKISINGGSFTVEATKYDLSFMVELKSPDTGMVLGRKWVYGVVDLCHTWIRDVDITYQYRSYQTFVPLLPDYDKAFYDIDANVMYPLQAISSSKWPHNGSITEGGPCGDHEGSWMFSPYEDCGKGVIQIERGPISLFHRIDTEFIADFRYMGPTANHPEEYSFNAAGFLWPLCYFEWSLGTFQRSKPEWSGGTRLRGPITEFENMLKYGKFIANGWKLPQLGNAGREHVRIQRTMHFREFMYTRGGPVIIGLGWMPAIPHVSSNSIFNSTNARSIFCNTGSSDTEPTIIPTFDEAYIVHKVDARWPPQEFYFNFKNPNASWVHPESQLDLERNAEEAIIGVSITNSSKDDRPTDLFGRPVYLGPDTGEVTVSLVTATFNEEDNSIKENAKIYIDERVPIYFDMFTGDVITALTPNIAGTSISDLMSFLESVGANPSIEAEFSPVLEGGADTPPEDISGVSSYMSVGNLICSLDVLKIYLNMDEDVISPFDPTASGSWVGFFPSLNVTSIVPKFLKKELIEFNSADFKGYVIYNNYPSSNWMEKYELSNTKIDLDEGLIDATWGGYSEEDRVLGPPNPGDIDERSGYTSNVYISVGLEGHPLELAILGIQIDIESPIDIENIPNLYIGLETYGGQTITLVESDKIPLYGGDTSITKNFNFSYEEQNTEEGVDTESSNIYLDPIYIRKILIDVGARGDLESLSIKILQMSGLKIVTEGGVYTETINVVRPGYIQQNIDESSNLLSPVSEEFLTGTKVLPDMGDVLEAQGIAEFWRPPIDTIMGEGEYVGTQGKLRKHVAGIYKTFDTKTGAAGHYLSFTDADTLAAEKRQIDISENFFKAIETDYSFMVEENYNYYIQPNDAKYCEKINGGEIPKGTVTFKTKNYETTNKGYFAPTSKTPGWQDPGYNACFANIHFNRGTRTGCVKPLPIGIRHGFITMTEDHSTCYNGTGGGGAYNLFEIMGLDRIMNVLGSTTQLGGAYIYDAGADLVSDIAVISRYMGPYKNKGLDKINAIRDSRYNP